MYELETNLALVPFDSDEVDDAALPSTLTALI